MAVNEVANISGTYGYFLSKFSKSSESPLRLKPTAFQGGRTDHIVMQGYAEEIAGEISADLCYLDPPYIKRQYAANYHILETLARGDEPNAQGKVGFAHGETNIQICVQKPSLWSHLKRSSEE